MVSAAGFIPSQQELKSKSVHSYYPFWESLAQDNVVKSSFIGERVIEIYCAVRLSLAVWLIWGFDFLLLYGSARAAE